MVSGPSTGKPEPAGDKPPGKKPFFKKAQKPKEIKPKAKVPDLKPKSLVNDATPMKNDPLWLDFEDHGFVGLTPYRGVNEFANTYEGLLPICEREYDLIGSVDRNFTKFVSRAMWNYYCVIHLYTRIIAIKKHKGEDSFQEARFIDSLRSENYPVPSCVDEYLKGVGATLDSAGVKYTLKFPAWPNRQGHFGVIDENTHWKYETFIAPIVLSHRIMNDVNKTENHGADPNWEIGDIAPENDNRGLPTANLLGWARATTLTSEQLAAIQGSGITADEFPTDNAQFQMNRGLFELIADKVRSLNRHIKLGSSLHESEDGSIAQTLWQQRDEREEEEFNRIKPYSEREVSVRSNAQHDKRITIAAMITTFRMRKEAIGVRHSWCCYDFGNYEAVPQLWINTRNTIHDYGRVASWNTAEFRSAYTGKDEIRTSWQRRGLLNPSRD